jgi:hypothetical protein
MAKIIPPYTSGVPGIPESDSKEVNAAILQWVPKVRSALKSSALRFSHGKNKSFVTRGNRIEKKLAESISSGTHKDYGQIDTVSFKFERHGVFVHKGVSRMHPITSPREKTDWFNPELEKYIPELADRLAEINADLLLKANILDIK